MISDKNSKLCKYKNMRNMQYKIQSYKKSYTNQYFILPYPIFGDRTWQLSNEVAETFCKNLWLSSCIPVFDRNY